MTANNSPSDRPPTEPSGTALPADSGSKTDTLVLPVIQEQLHVSKQQVDRGSGIRLHRHTVERTQVVDEPLREDIVDVVRVPVGTIVDSAAPPEPRQEGDTFIVPVLEEILVVERRLRLKEELHITRRQRERHAPQSVVVKSYEVQVERFEEMREPGAAPPGTPPALQDPKRNDNIPGDLAG